MKKIDGIRKTIDKYFSLANAWANEKCDNLLQAKSYKEFPKMVEEIVPLVERISKSQNQLIENLENMKADLQDYNIKRVVWIEFLIEMRETLTSNRRSMNLEFLFSFFSHFCGGNM